MGSAARPSAWTPWSLGGDLFKGGASQEPTVRTKRYCHQGLAKFLAASPWAGLGASAHFLQQNPSSGAGLRQTVRDRTTGRTSFVKPTGSSNFFASSKLEAARSSSKLCGAARSRRTSARNASRSLHPRTDRADGNPGNAERSPCALPTGSTARCSVDRIVRLVSHHGRCLCTALQSAADGDATRR